MADALTVFGLPKDAPVTGEGGGTADYLNVAQPFYLQQTNPETRFSSKEDVDPGFKWTDHQDYWNSLSIKEKGVVQDAMSIQHANKLLSRNSLFEDSLEKINNDPAWIKYPGLIGASATDPINFIPLAGAYNKANSLFRAQHTLSRMARTGLVVGTAGAVSNVASEALFEAQGLPTDYISSALFGFALGGGLGGLGEGLSRTMYKRQVATALDKENDPIMFYMDSDPVVTTVATPEGAPAQYTFTPKVDKVNNIVQPEFLKSDAMKLWESPVNEAREFVSKLVNPTVSAKGDDGITVPTSVTAYDKKIQWRGDVNTARVNQEMAYRDAKVDGYSGTREQFMTDVGMTMRRAINEQELRVYEYVEGLNLKGKERQAAINKAYDDLPIEILHKNPHIVKASQASQEYFGIMRERGVELGMDIFKTVPKGKGYFSRIYNFDAVRKMDEGTLSNRIREALKLHPANKGLLQKEELDIIVADITKKFTDMSVSNQFLDFSYFVPKELPLGTHLKERKIKLYEPALDDLLLNNVDDVQGMYHYKTSGQMAVQWAFGTTDLKDIRENVFSKLRDAGAHDEIRWAEDVLQDTLGVLRMPANANSFGWTVSRSMTAFNSTTFGGGFGLNTLTELTGALWATGFNQGFIRDMGPALKGVKELLFQGKAASTPYINELMAMGHLQDLLSVQGMNRLTDTEAVFNASKLEHGMMGLTEKLFKYNGMRAVTASLEAVVGANAITDIKRLAGKADWSDKEINRMARWGLDKKTVARLNKAVSTHAEYRDGKLFELNINKWDGEDLDMLGTAVSRAIRSGVIQGDTAHLPNWMIVPMPIKRMLTQFLRFPIAAHETLLRRGWQEDKAGLAATTIGAVMTYASITYLKEQASIAAGFIDEREAKYDVFNDPLGENTKRLFVKSSNYASGLGAFTILSDYIRTLSGQDYKEASEVLGPTVGRLGAFQDIMRQTVEGDPHNGRGWYALKTFVPFANVPMISEGINSIIDDNTY
jgi:hypothetical protein